MPSQLEYHVCVRHSIPASVALFSLFALPVFLASSSPAQINGAPSSVTSPGFGGRPVNGPPASVTSLGRNGYAPNSQITFSTANSGEVHHHRHHYVEYAPPVVYALPVPYAVDIGQAYDDDDANDQDANYQGGPTIFDRRGSGANSYIPPVSDVPAPHSPYRAENRSEDGSEDRGYSTSPTPEPPQPPTLLIFKDGHRLEVGNYAIIGEILFDLTPGHSRKVPLADLNLEATRKLNDDRGVTFQIPLPSQAN